MMRFVRKHTQHPVYSVRPQKEFACVSSVVRRSDIADDVAYRRYEWRKFRSQLAASVVQSSRPRIWKATLPLGDNKVVIAGYCERIVPRLNPALTFRH